METFSLAATAGYEKAAGYAIPVDATFRRVVDVLKEGREVEYGFLGIQPANVPEMERDVNQSSQNEEPDSIAH